MGEQERNSWAKVREGGLVKYSLSNALKSTLLCAAIYIFGNAYINRDNLDQYINDNINIALNHNLIILGITYAVLIVLSAIIFKINESRFNQTDK